MRDALAAGCVKGLCLLKPAAAVIVAASASSLLTAQDFLPWRAGRVAIVSFGLGAIPFSYLFAQGLAGVDLRQVGTGTVSGSGLYRVTGFAALVVAGGLDVLKGLPGVLAASDSGMVAAVAAAAAVAGHNWSPFLGGGGGRGFSVAMGAMALVAWPAMLLMAGALGLGRLARQSATFSLAALMGMPLLALWTHGRWPALTGLLILLLMIAKRLAGNQPIPSGASRLIILKNRLFYDNDMAG